MDVSPGGFPNRGPGEGPGWSGQLGSGGVGWNTTLKGAVGWLFQGGGKKNMALNAPGDFFFGGIFVVLLGENSNGQI